ncbi:hypothetical protein [Azospirillum doebereinerae]
MYSNEQEEMNWALPQRNKEDDSLANPVKTDRLRLSHNREENITGM